MRLVLSGPCGNLHPPDHPKTLLRRQKAWLEEKAAKDKEYAAQRAEMAGEHFDKEVRASAGPQHATAVLACDLPSLDPLPPWVCPSVLPLRV